MVAAGPVTAEAKEMKSGAGQGGVSRWQDSAGYAKHSRGRCSIASAWGKQKGARERTGRLREITECDWAISRRGVFSSRPDKR